MTDKKLQGWRADSIKGARLVVFLSEAQAIETERNALREAAQALGVMPDGYCFCAKERCGNKEHHEPECRDLREALATGS